MSTLGFHYVTTLQVLGPKSFELLDDSCEVSKPGYPADEECGQFGQCFKFACDLLDNPEPETFYRVMLAGLFEFSVSYEGEGDMGVCVESSYVEKLTKEQVDELFPDSKPEDSFALTLP